MNLGAINAPSASLPVRSAILIGGAAGAMSGLFGVGGGILIMPALLMFGRLPQRLAHGTSLVAVAPIALFGMAGFLANGKIDWTVAVLLMVGSITGASIGTRIAHRVPKRTLILSFVAILAFAAVQLFIHESSAAGRGDLDALVVIELLAVGLGGGLLAGLLGIGGGVVLVPAIILVVGLAPAIAKGSALAVMVPTAVVGTVTNVRRGVADVRAGAALGAAGAVTALTASQVSVALDERVSNILFAALLIAVGARLLYDDLRSPGSEH